jgi:acetyl-CoA carboxylase biotin carboxyl carrier protein
MELTHDDVKKILEIIDGAEHLDEVDLVYGGFHLRVHRGGSSEPRAFAGSAVGSPLAAARPSTPEPARPSTPAPAVQPAATTLRQGEIAIKAPMLGTFYRSPTPGAPPFVEVGQRVKADEVVCIIEVMKLFNSITAGVDGVVTRIPVENAKLVEYDQVLIVVSETD